jgi:predicted dehydrogenase
VNPLRLAIIGCGAITESLHLPAAELQKDVAVDCLIDVDPDLARALASKFRVSRMATSLAECIDLDAVLLATPPHVRIPLVQQAVSMGLHVLAEKPLGNTLNDCQAQIDAARSAGIILAAAHVYRFWPSRQRIFDVIRSQEFGKVKRIDISQGKPYSWKSVTGYTMQRELVPGGVLINAGIHPLDSLLWWLGDPVSVDYRDDAIGGLESNCLLDMSFPDEAQATLRMSRTSELRHYIHIRTDRALIDLPTYSRDHFFVERNGERMKVDCRAEAATDQEHLWPARDQFIDFAEAIRLNRPPKITGEEGARVVRLIEDCYRVKKLRPMPQTTPLPGEIW